MKLPKNIEDQIKKLNIIALMQGGSQVYGCDTKDSDIDLKGIFLPSKEQIYLGRIPRNISLTTKKNKDDKNTAEDIDVELFSIHEFLKLACDGQTIQMDMLHTPDEFILQKTPIWDEIVKNRSKFYTRNLSAFVGYARRQASKYGIKGSRLNDAKKVLDFFNAVMPKAFDTKLTFFWDELPEGEHIHRLDPNPKDTNQRRLYQVCGRCIDESARIKYAYDIVKNFYDNYGERARQAAENKGIDFKACSHAIRASIEVKQILTEGTIIFPLKEAGYLRDIKQGKLHYQKEVAPDLERRMEELELLAKESRLPDKVNRKYWDEFIYDVIDYFIYEMESWI